MRWRPLVPSRMSRLPTTRAARGAAVTVTVEALESRRLPSANPTGIPPLHSLRGAPLAVFLDFDGFGEALIPYDTDGDATTFGPSEQADIREAWRQIASYFSMFNVDVTTETPTVPCSYSIVSDGVDSGYNSGSLPSTAPTNLNPGVDARARQTAMAHEIGHSFGLDHQSEYDLNGARLREYHLGLDALHGAIMGRDFARDVHKWFIGHPASSAVTLQDDVAMIANRVRTFGGGDGFRPDDAPDSIDTAAPLAAAGDGGQAASGIIERAADADAYAFESAGGAVRIDLVPPSPSMLDAKLEVYAADGTLLACADAATNDQHLTLALPAGPYRAVVRSHGDYADLGPYDLSVRPTATPQPDEFDPALPAPGATVPAPAAGTSVDLAWTPADGAAGYAVERSDDGATWEQVTTTDASVTHWTDRPPSGGHRYFYRVRSTGPSGRSAPSPVATVVNRPDAPANFTVRLSGQRMVLNWQDVAGETSYRLERRVDAGPGGVGPWTLLGNLAPNVPSATDRTVPARTRYRYRLVAVGPGGESTPRDITAGSADVALSGLRVATAGETYAELTWDPIGSAVGYSVERSTDAVEFNPVGQVTAERFVDPALSPASIYHYRVIGTNDLGEIVTSAPVRALTHGMALPEDWGLTDFSNALGGAPEFAGRDGIVYDDVGGSFALIGGGAGTLAPTGAGRTSDSLRFVWTTLVGDGSITARIARLDAAPAGSFAGVMLRDGLDRTAAARFVFAGVSAPGNVGDNARDVAGQPAAGFLQYNWGTPCWVRIARSGDDFRVYERFGDTWALTSTYTIPMDPLTRVGLALSSGSDTTVTSATFDHVAVGGPGPLVEAVATASPALVDGDHTQLSVLASDNAGEASLTYTWSAAQTPPGAPPPTFTPNGTNDAKNSSAQFYRAGHYVLLATVTNPQGLQSTTTVDVDVLPTPTTFVLGPAGASVAVNETFQFQAVALDQFGQPLQASPLRPMPEPVITATCGTLDADHLYTAPTYAGWDGITASAGSAWAHVDVYVYDPSAGPALLSAVSRKTHGRRGTVDLPLLSFGGPPTVEPRRGGPTTLAFAFSADVAPADGALDAGDFGISNATFRSARIAGKTLTLELSGAADGSTVWVGLNGIAGTDGSSLAGDTDVEIRALYADVNQDGVVTPADFLALRTRQRYSPTAADLLLDIDLTGTITAVDLAACRRRLGRSVP